MPFKVGDVVKYKQVVYDRAGVMPDGSCRFWWVRKAGGVVIEPYQAPWAAVRVRWRWDANSFCGFTLEQAEKYLDVVARKMPRREKKARKKTALREVELKLSAGHAKRSPSDEV